MKNIKIMDQLLKRQMIFKIVCMVLFLIPNVVFAQKFTIPVLPDTQNNTHKKRGVLFSQIEWIEDKADSLKTPIVLHVGDVVNWDNFDQWELASICMRILDRANIPYVIVPGNHDSAFPNQYTGGRTPGDQNTNLRNTHKFNYFFPVKRFPLQKGRFEEHKSDNAYYIFEAGGLKWVVIALEHVAREHAAQWMDETLKKFPDHNAIILTHYHLSGKGEIGASNLEYGNMAPVDIFDKYIKPHKNVLMVLSGHTQYSAWRADKGNNGNTIYQILQDYQSDIDNGYIRLLDFDIQNKTISAKIYSPITNITLEDESKITFTNVQFIR